MSQNTRMVHFKKDFFEHEAWKKEQVILGVDEVGRGCLAGPVVTAAVALSCRKTNKLLRDSKAMTASEREKAYEWIISNCQYSIAVVNSRTIDTINIWQSTLKAMKKSVLHLIIKNSINPNAIVVDAMPLKLFNTPFDKIPIHHFIKGESLSSSIAAASIIAKVTRDRLMKKFDLLFPYYNLAQHKGYATPMHQAAVIKHGHSIIHRTSFTINGFTPTGIKHDQTPTGDQQQTLC